MKYLTNFAVWSVGIRLVDIWVSVNNFIKIGTWLELFVPFNWDIINTHLLDWGLFARVTFARAEKGNPFAIVLIGVELCLLLFSEFLLPRIGIRSWWGRILFNLGALLVLTIAVDYVIFGSWDAGQALLESFSLSS
jgi:hypothetical protein